jgi:hypothetical protein
VAPLNVVVVSITVFLFAAPGATPFFWVVSIRISLEARGLSVSLPWQISSLVANTSNNS